MCQVRHGFTVRGRTRIEFLNCTFARCKTTPVILLNDGGEVISTCRHSKEGAGETPEATLKRSARMSTTDLRVDFCVRVLVSDLLPLRII